MKKTIIRIDHMCCGAEAKVARELLDPIEDVKEVKISVNDRRAAIEHRATLEASEIVRILNTRHLGASIAGHSSTEGGGAPPFNWMDALRASVAAGQVLLFGAALLLHARGWRVGSLAAAWASIGLSWPMWREAFFAVLRRAPNVEFLMAAATAGALVLGEVLEAASVGAVVSIMDAVKLLAVERFERQLRGAAAGAPPRIDVPGGGDTLVSELKPGDSYIARAGDELPADGTVVKGEASVDESSITGEALPRHKEEGAVVSGGSIVASGYLEVKCDRPAPGSFQARMEDMVREAQGTLSEAEAQVGKFAKYYTPAVLALSAAIGLWRGLHQGLVVLVAGCPCALLGAAPFAHAAALAMLARRHSLMLKRSSALEALGQMKTIGLDKTGTLTRGAFELLKLVPTAGHERGVIHRWIAAVEARDPHPLARSLVQSFTGCVTKFTGQNQLPAVDEFTRHGRHGVSARVDGHHVGVGNADYLAAAGVALEGDAASQHAKWRGGGHTVLFATVDGTVAAVLILEDSLRPEASAVVAKLRELGVRTLLLTGDGKEPAARAAAGAGIPADDVHARLLPEIKARILLEHSCAADEQPATALAALEAPLNGALGRRGSNAVGFVGDGLNDCAALASAHVGVVLQQVGSQATVDAASAVLAGNLGELPAAIVVARRTAKLVTANVALALALNAAVIVVAATVGMPLWVSVVFDNGGLLLVLANSCWPLCWKVPTVDAMPARMRRALERAAKKEAEERAKGGV